MGSRVGAGMAPQLFPNIHDDVPTILMMDGGFANFREADPPKKGEKKPKENKDTQPFEFMDAEHILFFSS